jgi:P pilus assembly chaperone PapD
MLSQIRVIRITILLFVKLLLQRGSKASVILPDGTRVWLNADSKSITEGLQRKSRDVYLEGKVTLR